MHAHDRTLLASLAFADKDKQDPRHDWACQYLAQESVMWRMIFGVLKARGDNTTDTTKIRCTVRHEVAISKGKDQYKTTIGFLDLCYEFHDERLVVEVKINPCSTGDILRQIALYGEYVRGGMPHAGLSAKDGMRATFIVVTAFPLTQADVAMLAQSDVLHFRLGESFDEYCKQRSANSGTDGARSPEL